MPITYFYVHHLGLVGNDGATHHGTFDLAYLSCIPEVIVMAPSDESELQNMVETLYTIDDRYMLPTDGMIMHMYIYIYIYIYL